MLALDGKHPPAVLFLTDSSSFSQNLIADDLSQVKLFPNSPWTFPDGNPLVEWVVALRNVPAGTPGLKKLRTALQQISADLSLLTPVTDDDGEEDFEPITNPDLPQDDLEDSEAPPDSQMDIPPAEEDTVDKGKQRAAVPSATPDAEIDEAMKLINAETQKEMAGRKILEQQNLIVQTPGVSFFPHYPPSAF